MAVSHRWRIAWGLALLCAAAYAPAFFAVARGNLPFGSDAVAAFGPWHEFARASLLRGTLPLWNPHAFCGMPFMANGQSAVLYGPNVLYLWLPLGTALLCDAWLHTFILALGTYALARALGQSRSGALLAAGALALCGAVSARIYVGHMTWHAARAWMPWMLWALLGLLRHGRSRDALLLATCGALLLSAGHPPMALLGLSFCGGVVVSRTLSRRWSGHGALLPCGIVLLGLTALLTFALSAATLLPMLESSRLSTHGGFGFEFATRGSGTWRSLVRLLLPDFFGGNAVPQRSLPLYGHEETASLGLLAGLMALAAPFLARDAKGRLPHALLWLWLLPPVGFMLAMGKNTPFYRFAFDHWPGFPALRVPVRWLELWLLPGALLAGFSFDGVFAHRHRNFGPLIFRGMLLGVAAILAMLTISLAVSPPLKIDSTTSLADTLSLRGAATKASLIGFVVAALGTKFAFDARIPQRNVFFRRAFVVLALGEVLCLFWRSARPATPAESIVWPPHVRAAYLAGQRWETHLGGEMPQMNGGLTSGIDLFNGYDPAAPRRFFRFASALEGYSFYSLSYEPIFRTAFLRVASVTHGLKRDFTLEPYDGAWPRIYLTDHILRLPEDQQLKILKELAPRDFTGQKWPVVVATGALSEVKEDAKAGRVLNWHRDLNRLDVAVATQAPTVLVANEAYYPGWHAFVTNESRTIEVKITPANYLFRGVALPAGTQRVTMVYEPLTARLGFFLMLTGLGALAGGATILIKRQP